MLQYLRGLALRSARENTPLVLIVAIYLALVKAAAQVYTIDVQLRLYNSVWLSAAAILIWSLFLLGTAYALVRTRPERPLPFLRDLYLKKWDLPSRVAVALPAIVILSPLLSAYTSVKHSIHLLNSHLMDHSLIGLDRAIHGTDAWRLLEPLFAWPPATFALDWLYLMWFIVKFVVLSAVMFCLGDAHLKRQYVVSFALSWVLIGGVSAILFASVGPCYLPVFMPDAALPFAPLVAHLNELNASGGLHAMDVQKGLLADYARSGPGLGRGISAMPSMHVAIAMLNAILGWRVSRFFGILATTYLIAIMLGSVHLGWHYAVDGYFSIIAATLVWRLSGWIVRTDAPFSLLRRVPAPA